MSAASNSKVTEAVRVSIGAAWLVCASGLGWAQVPVVSEQVFPHGAHRDLVVRACAACHPPESIVAKRRSAQDWDEVIARMIERGAVASDEEQQQILEYLVRFYGAD
jgi:hypothetical protein